MKKKKGIIKEVVFYDEKNRMVQPIVNNFDGLMPVGDGIVIGSFERPKWTYAGTEVIRFVLQHELSGYLLDKGSKQVPVHLFETCGDTKYTKRFFVRLHPALDYLDTSLGVVTYIRVCEILDEGKSAKVVSAEVKSQDVIETVWINTCLLPEGIWSGCVLRQLITREKTCYVVNVSVDRYWSSPEPNSDDITGIGYSRDEPFIMHVKSEDIS